MKYNLCLYTDSHEPSGMGQVMLTLAEGLRRDFRVTFVGERVEGSQALFRTMQDLDLAVLDLLSFAPEQREQQLARWLVRHEIHLLNNHAGIGWEGHLGVRAAVQAGLPVIVRTEHLPYLITHDWQKAEHRAMLEPVQRLICVSEEACHSFRQAGIPERKLSYVQNGIPSLKPAGERTGRRRRLLAELGLPVEAALALSVGRLVEQKGYHNLLDSARLVCQRNARVHFVWVGQGPLEGELRQRIEQEGLAGRVHLLGRRPDVESIMAGSDMFVMATRFEGLPLVVLEAMAAGLPVISTRASGLQETVLDGQTGCLVDLDDPTALAEAILDLAGRPALAHQMGQAGLARQQQKFNADRMVRETAHIFYQLLGQATLELTPLAVAGQEKTGARPLTGRPAAGRLPPGLLQETYNSQEIL